MDNATKSPIQSPRFTLTRFESRELIAELIAARTAEVWERLAIEQVEAEFPRKKIIR